MRRRYILKNKKRFAALIMLLSFITVFTGLIVNAGAASQENNIRHTVYVEKGDTLWEIASAKIPDSDIREYIYDIKKLNNLSGDDIFAGQELLLP